MTNSIAELDRQATDPESKARELRSRIAQLKKLKDGQKPAEDVHDPAPSSGTGTPGASP
jgi:hypothetical protein